MLWVRTRYGDYTRVQFLIDTGADVSAVPIPKADGEAIPFRRVQPRDVYGVGGSAAGYRDAIQVIVQGEPFVWPCSFYELPPDRDPLPVLGRRGFLQAFDFCLKERTCTLRRRGWRWAWLAWLSPWRRLWRGDEPL
jgi:hypothetical protein